MTAPRREDRPDAAPASVSRRAAMLGTAAATAAVGVAAAAASAGHPITGALAWQDGWADPPEQTYPDGPLFFSAAEHAFVTAAADRIIPPDEHGPGAVAAGVVGFIDRQLAGAYGGGEHLYMGGPWPKGTPSQGWQQRLSPAGLVRAGIAATEGWIGHEHGGKAFADLDAATQDGVLSRIENGQAPLGQVDGKEFFVVLVDNVRAGFFSDPIYGGNKDMVGWRMIGFPGARYDYREWIDRHGALFPGAPVGLVAGLDRTEEGK